MVALDAGFATRVFFDPGELPEAAVKRFLLPARARGGCHKLLVSAKAKSFFTTHSMPSFETTGLTKRTAKGSCLQRTSSPVLHPPGGGASACYPTCLPAFTSRLLFRVVRNVQPARQINFGVPLPLYRASNRRVRAWRLPSAMTWTNRA